MQRRALPSLYKPALMPRRALLWVSAAVAWIISTSRRLAVAGSRWLAVGWRTVAGSRRLAVAGSRWRGAVAGSRWRTIAGSRWLAIAGSGWRTVSGSGWRTVDGSRRLAVPVPSGSSCRRRLAISSCSRCRKRRAVASRVPRILRVASIRLLVRGRGGVWLNVMSWPRRAALAAASSRSGLPYLA